MATGLEAINGLDLDDVFDPYVQGTSPSTTGFELSSGVDINTRYAPIVFGSAAAITGLEIPSGTDLNTLFAAKGTAVYWDGTLVPMPTEFSDNGNADGRVAITEIIFRPNGTMSSRKNYPITEVVLGNWSGSIANSSNTEIRFTPTSGTLDTNSAPTFTALNSTRVFNISVLEGNKQTTVLVELRQTGTPVSTISKLINLSVSQGL